MAGEAVAVEVPFTQPLGLDHGPHAPVQEKDAGAQLLAQALDAFDGGG